MGVGGWGREATILIPAAHTCSLNSINPMMRSEKGLSVEPRGTPAIITQWEAARDVSHP